MSQFLTAVYTVTVFNRPLQLLSQIKFIYADSEYGNVLHDYLNNRTLIEWEMDKENGRKLKQCTAGVKSVGMVVKDLIGYKQTPFQRIKGDVKPFLGVMQKVHLTGFSPPRDDVSGPVC